MLKNKEQVLLLTFQNRSLVELIRDVFRKFSLTQCGVLKAEMNAVERTLSSVAVQMLMSAVRSLAPH
jgi:hypothetical protein